MTALEVIPYPDDRLSFPTLTYVHFVDVKGNHHRVVIIGRAPVREIYQGAVVHASEYVPGTGWEPCELATLCYSQEASNMTRTLNDAGTVTIPGSRVLVVARIVETRTGANDDMTRAMASHPRPDETPTADDAPALSDVRLTAWQWLVLKEQIPQVFDMMCDAERK